MDGGGGPTLGGTGNTVSNVNVKNGVLSPGGNAGAAGSAANVGKLTTGALTLAPSAASVFDLSSGTGYDQLFANGSIILDGTLTLNVPAGAAFTTGQVLDLFHANGTNRLTGTFSNFANLGQYAYGGETFLAAYTPTDFTLTALNTVPEPATWLGGALLLGGGAGLILRRCGAVTA